VSITKEELLKGRDIQFQSEYTDVISANLDALLIPLNKIRDAYGSPMIVNSGWRPASINASTPGAAKNSAHCIGLAADISDPNGLLWKWVLENLQLMKDLNIYLEDKRWTSSWVHFGLVRPASGHRIFIPSANRPLAPGAWDGIYDHDKYD
jgi:hypothetical protein